MNEYSCQDISVLWPQRIENNCFNTYLNEIGALPPVKLKEGGVLGSKETAGVEFGGLKLYPPDGVEVGS